MINCSWPVIGGIKLTLLSTLNASARSCNLIDSVKLMFFKRAMSMLKYFGELMIARGVFPVCPGAGSACRSRTANNLSLLALAGKPIDQERKGLL